MAIKLELLFKAFSVPSFCVLGAGVSARIIPRTQLLYDHIITIWKDFGFYPVEPSPSDAVKERIIGDRNSKDPLWDVLPPSGVHAIALQKLALKGPKTVPSEYSVFALASKPSIIFSMNIDGLAKRYCSGHIILEPHGQVPREIVSNPFWNDDVIDGCLEFGTPVPKIPGKPLLPQSELKDITNRSEYIQAIKLFPEAHYLVIIGYSFGKFRNSIDDSETFEYFRELLRRYPKPVIVIDPYPHPIAAMIQEAIRQKEVYQIPAYWNHLSHAIVEIALSHGCCKASGLASLAPKILYRYNEFVMP